MNIQNLEILCRSNHQNQKIIQILKDRSLPIQSRLLCQQCIDEIDHVQNAMSFNNAKSRIEIQQATLVISYEEMINEISQQLNQFNELVDQLKTKVLQSLDELKYKSNDWINALQIKLTQKRNYNLLEELSKLETSFEEKNTQNIKEIYQLNYDQFVKIENIFSRLLLFDDLEKCENTLKAIFKIRQINPKVILPVLDFNQKCIFHGSEITHINLRQKTLLQCGFCILSQDSITIQQFKLHLQILNEKQEKSFQKQTQKFESYFQNAKSQINQYNQGSFLQIKNLINQIEKDMLFQFLKQEQQNEVTITKIIDQLHGSQNIIESYFTNLRTSFKKQIALELKKNTIQIRDILQQILKESNNIQYKQIGQCYKQNDYCIALAFNPTNSIMIAGSGSDIQVYKFSKGKIQESQLLKAHDKFVTCLAFSKKDNSFFSGSQDKTIQFWKQMNNDIWIKTSLGKKHKETVMSILLNLNEDELISCCLDRIIYIWSVNCSQNQFQLQYQLEGHNDEIYCISLNQSETNFVSCSKDKKIIVWGKGQDQKWQFYQQINVNDLGYRIAFLDDDTFVWQQANKGISLFYGRKRGCLFEEKKDQKLQLNEELQDKEFFPTIYNEDCKLLIQKHNQYVYVIQNKQIKNIINCSSQSIYGGLTNDGQYLVLWNYYDKGFRVYELNEI